MAIAPLKTTLDRLWPTLRRFSAYLAGDWLLMATACGIILGISLTNSAMIWLIGKPVDLLYKGQYSSVRDVLFMFAAIVLLNQLLHFGAITLNGWLTLRFIGRVREAMLAKCLAASSPVMDQYPKGDVLTRLSGDLDKVSHLAVDTPLTLASHLFIFIFYAAMLLWIDVGLALAALAISPIFLLHQHSFGQRNRRVSQKFLDAFGQLLAFESETLNNLRGISSFNAEKQVSTMHRAAFESAADWSFKSRRLSALFHVTFSVLIYVSGLSIVLIAISAIDRGTFTVGHLVSFLLYLGYISAPVKGVAHLALQWQEDMAAAERVAGVLDVQLAVTERPDATELKVTAGRIEFEHVTFSYPGGNAIVSDVNLELKPGQTIALVGPSGSGKSTFVKLLMRFYDPQEGAVLIDGMDIRRATLASLRKQLAVVWQEPFLVSDTIRANLLLARPEATDSDMVKACEAGYAWEFVAELEHGLDTRIGANGVELSAGQRQRLSLAQAFLRDAPFLLLDEASSALDSHAEQMVVQAIDKLRRGRTTIIVAHRYSSIRSADHVVYFNGDGTITTGTHQELLASHPGHRAAAQWQLAIHEQGTNAQAS
jgi:ABC-type multidrug transport system fused ATPase/permease subunit